MFKGSNIIDFVKQFDTKEKCLNYFSNGSCASATTVVRSFSLFTVLFLFFSIFVFLSPTVNQDIIKLLQ